jgi:hypothetical protein
MNIRFISSLDADDELRFASAAFSAVTRLLDSMPIAYTLRLETADGNILEHHHAADVSTVVMTEPVEVLQSLMVERPKSS